MNLNLYFLANRGVINVAGVIWGPQHLCHYVMHAPGPVFSILTVTIASVYESYILRALLQLLRVKAIITTASDR